MAGATETLWKGQSSDGEHTLYASIWTPDDGGIRAVIQICHGMTEHIRCYDRFARALCAHGFVVCGDDHLGHGRTAERPEDLGFFGERDGVRHLVEDEQRLREEMQHRYPDKPYFLLGHSMGSFITRRYITQYADGLAGYICCGTAGRNPLAGLGIGLANLMVALRGAGTEGRFLDRLAFGTYNDRFGGNGPSRKWLTRDTQSYPDVEGDEKWGFVFTNAGFRDLFRLLRSVTGMPWARRVPAGLPIALFSGDMDPVGSFGKGPRQVYGWLKKAGVQDVSLKLYPDARHELHNEINRDEFLRDVVTWVEQHLA